jgi:hypothetical protein
MLRPSGLQRGIAKGAQPPLPPRETKPSPRPLGQAEGGQGGVGRSSPRDYGTAGAVLRAVFALAAIAATLMWGRLAHADAAPVQLVLLYMPNVSTTGTTSASGVAELVMSEGEVRIKTAGLPRLDGDNQYVAWLVNSTTNDFQRLGAFNTAGSTGAVDYETVENDAIADKQWNLLLVTVEDSATPESPGKRHSIAGVFPSADNAPLPIVLPNTGGAPNASCQPSAMSCQLDSLGTLLSFVPRAEWLAAAVLGALLLGITFGAGYVAGKRRV